MKRSWKTGIKKQTVILGIWAAAGALLTAAKVPEDPERGRGSVPWSFLPWNIQGGWSWSMQSSLPWIITRTASRC